MIKKTLLKTTSMITLAMTIMAFSPSLANAAWKQNSTGWWFTEGSSYATGWRQISGTWYYFDANGYMKTGWVKDGGSWYYMDKSGAMKTGWVKDGGSWYFMNNSGVMQTGWVSTGGSWYYMNSSGVMQTEWIYDGNNYYFLDDDGRMLKDNWVSDGENYYLVGSSGAMVTGFYTYSDGTTYYCYENGVMATNDLVDGYLIDEHGVVSKNKANLTYSPEDAFNLIGKEDYKFIEDFQYRQNINDADLAIASVSKASYFLSDYKSIKEEIVYLMVLCNPHDTDLSEAYFYFVGATSGKVYISGIDEGSKIYEIKDNAVVNSYVSSQNTSARDWR